jgi:hypothetical protein
LFFNRIGGKQTFAASASVSIGQAKQPFTRQNDHHFRWAKYQVSNVAQKRDFPLLRQWLNAVMETKVGN